MSAAPAFVEPQADMERLPCEICGSDDRTLVQTRTDLFLGGTTEYTMVRCGGCGVIYQYPRPTPATIGRFYPSDYQQYTPGLETESWLKRLDRRYGLLKRCRIVTRHVAAGRLLDVGCATGDFLDEMRRQPGWAVAGLEPIQSAAAYANQSTGVPVSSALPNAAPFVDAAFDAITLWDVLEHVHDPRGVLAEIARLLRPGGVVVINHPNWDSVDRRWFGRFWLGFELPRHLHIFPREMLAALMAEYGFTAVEERCLYGSNAATSTSLALLAEATFGAGRLTRAIRAVVFSKLWRVALLPVFKVIDDRGMGSNITVVFRKTQ